MSAIVGFIFLGFCIVIASVIFMSVKVFLINTGFVKKIGRYGIIGSIAVIFSVISVLIGIRINDRHKNSFYKLSHSVSQIWGGSIVQEPPRFYTYEKYNVEYDNKVTGKVEVGSRHRTVNLGFDEQIVKVNIKANIRKKGLLIFPGYNLFFKGKYIIKNNTNKNDSFAFDFNLPSNAGNIQKIKVLMDGKFLTQDTNYANGINWYGNLKIGESKTFEVSYESQGAENFKYSIGNNQYSTQVAYPNNYDDDDSERTTSSSYSGNNTRQEIKKFDLTIETDFENYDIPEGSMVPNSKTNLDNLSTLKWSAENLITGQNVALKFEVKGNYGSLIAKVFFYSPLAILLFTGLLLIISVSKDLKLHPMNFLFILVGFFLFYILCSYLISFIPIIFSVPISLLFSSSLMIYYSKLIKKGPILDYSIATGSLVFQWIFSIAFFFPEYTGLIITLSGIFSFVILMKLTADVKWDDKW